MARSCATKNASVDRRRSNLSWRNQKRFKQRRKSRSLTLKVREAEKSDGIWPILPYIVSTKELCSASTSNSAHCESESPEGKSQKINESTVSRFNIFEKLLQDEKIESTFDLSSLGEQSILQEEKELTDFDLTLINEVNESEETKAVNATEKNLETHISRCFEDHLDRSCLTGASSSFNRLQSNNVEVVTLTDDENDVKSADRDCEVNESEVILLDEITNFSELVTSEASVASCSSSSTSLIQEMPSYTYKFCLLRDSLRYMNFPSLNEKAMLKCLPLADEAAIFNDLLSERTAKVFGHLVRRWEKVERKNDSGTPFRICSYNILCQDTMERTSFLYRHLRGCTLQWNKRSKLLFKELVMIDADVLCLQEVQDLHYSDFYLPFFEAMGYKGIYKKKTGDLVDGCAIFYRNRFQLLSNTSIEYFVGSHTILNRNNVGQLIRLRDKETQKEFCVANTHLLFDAKRGDIKLAQLAILLAHLDKCCGPSSLKPCPYILCGDFNISPFCAVYNFLLENRLCFKNLYRNELSGQGFYGGPPVKGDLMPAETNINRNCQFGEVSDVKMTQDEWTHNLKFASVYHHFDVFNEPEISSFNSEEAVNPDLMLYSVFQKTLKEEKNSGLKKVDVCENSLKLLRRLSLPNEKSLKATLGPWPNKNVPSDHIPLIADFCLD